MRGAPRAFGLDGTGVPPPRWSARDGEVLAVAGPTAVLDDGCLAAVDARDGRQRWAAVVPGMGHGLLAGVAVGPGIVVVATVHIAGGHGPGTAAYWMVDGLVGVDSQTGRRRWALALADDSQSVPAVVAGGLVVVSQADGTVIGLAAATGARRWADPRPRSCSPGPQATVHRSLWPIASVVAGGPPVTVGYDCAGYSEVARIDPATGALRWALRVRPGSVLGSSEPAAAAAGVLVLAAGALSATAPAHRTRWLLGPVGYVNMQVLAIDEANGRPIWQMDGVPPSSAVFAGAGRVCVASPFGVECLGPRSGAEKWQWRPPAVPDHGGPASPVGGIATAAGRLYVVAPTPAARRIDPESSTQRSPPGTFHLRVMDMATGHVTADQPLPAYYGGHGGVVVSVRTPPGVMAAGAGMVFVSPQLGESQVVEALAP